MVWTAAAYFLLGFIVSAFCVWIGDRNGRRFAQVERDLLRQVFVERMECVSAVKRARAEGTRN